MSCVWSKATYVGGLVRDLARKHGLAVYDPQSDKVIYPDGSAGRPEDTSRGSLWVVGCFAVLFAVILVYSERLAASRAPVVLYVLAGLCGLLAVACFRQALR
jgi:hypothetical protein